MAPKRVVDTIGIAALAAVLLVLGGCREHLGLDTPSAIVLANPEKRHPIGFSSRTEALYVEIAPAGDGLSLNQQTDVLRFVERFKVEGSGRLTIATPGTVRGRLASSKTARHVEDIVQAAGLPPEAVATVRATGDSRYGPAIRLAYERPVAVAPQCGDWSEDLGENRERLPHPNFGCAMQRNLALSVATSRDLQVPQPEHPRAGEQRTAVWGKFSGAGSGGGGAAPATPPAAAPTPSAPSPVKP